MTRSEYLANRLREVLLNGHWVANTNFAEQIQNLGLMDATQRASNLNTVAELVFHINYYLSGLLRAFEIGKLDISDKYSFDLAPFTSEEEWILLKQDFLDNAVAFANVVEQMEDSKFDEPFVDEKYGTFLRNIEGVIEHSYYHLGQIVLINKMNAVKTI